MLVGWLLAKKGMKYGFVPASYVAVPSPCPTPTRTSSGTQSSIMTPEQKPKRLFERNLLPIYDSNPNSNEKLSPTGTFISAQLPMILEQAPKRLSERNPLPIYDSHSNPKEKLISSNAAEEATAEEAKSKSPRFQESHLLGLECEPEREKIDTLGRELHPELAAVQKPRNPFSWYGNESQQFITIVRKKSISLDFLKVRALINNSA